MKKLFTQHPRSFETNRFVYPVVSRRSGGVSVGVNLNPDKVCNFDCIYCQVDRTTTSETTFVGTEQLLSELDHMLAASRPRDSCSSIRVFKTRPRRFAG